jgi:hypothetical protein
MQEKVIYGEMAKYECEVCETVKYVRECVVCERRAKYEENVKYVRG